MDRKEVTRKVIKHIAPNNQEFAFTIRQLVGSLDYQKIINEAINYNTIVSNMQASIKNKIINKIVSELEKGNKKSEKKYQKSIKIATTERRR